MGVFGLILYNADRQCLSMCLCVCRLCEREIGTKWVCVSECVYIPNAC